MWVPLLLSGISVIGLGVGGLLSNSINRFFPKNLPYIYVICGGVLVGILMFDLIPHTLTKYDNKGLFIGFVTGYVVMLLIDHILHLKDKKASSNNALKLLVTAIFFHHIIMGFSYGAITLSDNYSFLTAIILHQIPEGIAIMITLLVTKMKEFSFFFIIAILSVVFGVSAILGATFHDKAKSVDTLLTGNAIGTLFFVTINEIIAKSKKHFGWMPLLLMIIIGMLLIQIYLIFLEGRFLG